MSVSPDAAGLVAASSVRTRQVEWLVARWIPLGGISLLAGKPGAGKSLWTLRLAARLSVGELTGRPEQSLILSAEDSAEAVIVPRLREAGADDSLVFLPSTEQQEQLWLPSAVSKLEKWVESKKLRLLVIDPLTAYLPDGKVDTWRDSSVRSALAPLSRLAASHNLAVVAVVHLNKGSGTDPFRRVGGSIGLPAAARSVLLLAADPGDRDGDRRVLAHAKSNYGQQATSISLEIVENGATHQAKIVERGSSPYLAPELLSEPEDSSRLEEAMDFLLEELSAGARPAKKLFAKAAARGICEKTLRRAKQRLGVTAAKVGFDHWAWALPSLGAVPDDTPAA